MTLPLSSEGRLAIYLLHFEQPVEGARHYVGITTYERLHARMIEHTTGRGSKLTAAACRQRTPWRLAAFWRTDDPAMERQIIALGDSTPCCPVCRSMSTGVKYRPTKKRPADQASLFSTFDLAQRSLFPNALPEHHAPQRKNGP